MKAFVSIDCLSKPRPTVTAVKKNSKLLFFDAFDSTFDIYDLTTHSWSIEVLPFPNNGHTVYSYNDIIYITDGNQVWKLEF